MQLCEDGVQGKVVVFQLNANLFVPITSKVEI